MKKSRMFSLAMLVCLIVRSFNRNQRMYRSRMCMAFVNATLGLEDLEKKMEDKK